MKYLLDTNVCIGILKGKSPILLKKILGVKNEDICVPSIVRFELFYGAYKSNQSEKTIKILENFISQFQSAEFNDETAKIVAKIRFSLEHSGAPIGPCDLLIAAIAISNNMVLVTHNVKEFSRIEGLNFEDWEA